MQANSWFMHTVLQMFDLLPCNVCIKSWVSHGGETLHLSLSDTSYLVSQETNDQSYVTVSYMLDILVNIMVHLKEQITYLCYICNTLL